MASKKILIVDDDNKNIFALSAVLRSYGYDIVTASDVEQGLQILRSDDTIGVVLSDIMMPGQDGFDLIRNIRNDELLKHMPVVALTAQAMVGDREKCIEAGADDYISKPVDVDRLINTLSRYEIA